MNSEHFIWVYPEILWNSKEIFKSVIIAFIVLLQTSGSMASGEEVQIRQNIGWSIVMVPTVLNSIVQKVWGFAAQHLLSICYLANLETRCGQNWYCAIKNPQFSLLWLEFSLGDIIILLNWLASAVVILRYLITPETPTYKYCWFSISISIFITFKLNYISWDEALIDILIH